MVFHAKLRICIIIIILFDIFYANAIIIVYDAICAIGTLISDLFPEI